MDATKPIQIEGRAVGGYCPQDENKTPRVDVGYAFGQAPISVPVQRDVFAQVDAALNAGEQPDCVVLLKFESKATIVGAGERQFATNELGVRPMGLKLKRAA